MSFHEAGTSFQSLKAVRAEFSSAEIGGSALVNCYDGSRILTGQHARIELVGGRKVGTELSEVDEGRNGAFGTELS